MRKFWLVLWGILCSFYQSYADQPYVNTESCQDENDDGNVCCERSEGLGYGKVLKGYDENITPFSMRIDYAASDESFTSDVNTRVPGKPNNHEEKERNKAMTSARSVLREALDERCDWRMRPLAFIKGEVCGSYYKIFHLDRNEPMNKDILKQAFLTMTKGIEPDIYTMEDVTDAYSYIHLAFGCLSDDLCRQEYNKKLDVQAVAIAQGRRQLREDVQEIALHVARKAYGGVSIGSGLLYEWGMDLWKFVTQWQMEVPEVGVIPLGKFLMTFILFMKGQILMKLHGLTWLIVRIDQEIQLLMFDAINGY